MVDTMKQKISVFELEYAFGLLLEVSLHQFEAHQHFLLHFLFGAADLPSESLHFLFVIPHYFPYLSLIVYFQLLDALPSFSFELFQQVFPMIFSILEELIGCCSGLVQLLAVVLLVNDFSIGLKQSHLQVLNQCYFLYVFSPCLFYLFGQLSIELSQILYFLAVFGNVSFHFSAFCNLLHQRCVFSAFLFKLALIVVDDKAQLLYFGQHQACALSVCCHLQHLLVDPFVSSLQFTLILFKQSPQAFLLFLQTKAMLLTILKLPFYFFFLRLSALAFHLKLCGELHVILCKNACLCVVQGECCFVIALQCAQLLALSCQLIQEGLDELGVFLLCPLHLSQQLILVEEGVAPEEVADPLLLILPQQ